MERALEKRLDKKSEKEKEQMEAVQGSTYSYEDIEAT